MATAEIACKAAKDRGRNRLEVFQDSDQSIIRRHTDILVIGKLRDALDLDSFRLDAQRFCRFAQITAVRVSSC